MLKPNFLSYSTHALAQSKKPKTSSCPKFLSQFRLHLDVYIWAGLKLKRSGLPDASCRWTRPRLESRACCRRGRWRWRPSGWPWGCPNGSSGRNGWCSMTCSCRTLLLETDYDRASLMGNQAQLNRFRLPSTQSLGSGSSWSQAELEL